MPAFTCARAIGNLWSNYLGVNILSLAPLVALSFALNTIEEELSKSSIVFCYVKHLNIIQCTFFAPLIYAFVSLFISFRFDLNSAWSFFASATLIWSSLVLSKRLKTLWDWSNFESAVLPLYLYIKPSELTFPTKLVISSSLLFKSSLNISFCFEIIGVSSLS